MIKLERGQKPEILSKENVSKWTKSWKARMKNWSWPQVNHVRLNHSLRDAMEDWHHSKCAFCEDQSRSFEVEHFKAKSQFPDLAFEWENLLLACSQCNRIKGDRDIRQSLKPDIDDPEFFLWVNPVKLQVEPIPTLNAEQKQRAKDTIELFGLNRPELKIAYWHHWQTIAGHPGQPRLSRISLNSLDTGWISEVIKTKREHVEGFVVQEAPFSLMVKSFLKVFNRP